MVMMNLPTGLVVLVIVMVFLFGGYSGVRISLRIFFLLLIMAAIILSALFGINLFA